MYDVCVHEGAHDVHVGAGDVHGAYVDHDVNDEHEVDDHDF